MERALKSKTILHAMKRKAEEAYNQGRYSESIRLYAQILLQESEELEIRAGLLLADMALDYEEESKAIYEYYQLLKRHKPKDAHRIIIEMIENFDGNLNELVSTAHSSAAGADLVHGILYSDFKRLVQERGDFKNTFEDILFSSKIIITEKEEFFDMLEHLLEYGFGDMAMNYLETIGDEFIHEPRLQEIYKKVAKL